MRGKEGNKKRAEGAFPPLLLFCLVRFAAQHDIAERTHEWSEGGWCVGQGRTEGRRGGVAGSAALASLQLATNIP